MNTLHRNGIVETVSTINIVCDYNEMRRTVKCAYEVRSVVPGISEVRDIRDADLQSGPLIRWPRLVRVSTINTFGREPCECMVALPP